MRFLTTITRVVAGIFLAQSVTSWSTVAKSTAASGGDIFIYEFHEPLHTNNTNYKITVTPSKIYFAIDAFANVVSTDTLKLSRKKYTGFVKPLYCAAYYQQRKN